MVKVPLKPKENSAQWLTLSPEMKRVLRRLRRAAPQDARSLQCGYRTLVALERRKLITVETTFASIAFPRTALAYPAARR